MTEKDIQFTVTDWGIDFVPPSGFELNDDNILSVIDFVVLKAKEAGKFAILYDETNVIRKVTHFKVIEAVEYFQIIGIKAGLRKQAFLLPLHADTGNVKFIQNVGFNRGVIMRHFFEKEKAIEWLQE